MVPFLGTYIFFLVRQIGLGPPEGWCGPAIKSYNYTYKLLNETDNLQKLKIPNGNKLKVTSIKTQALLIKLNKPLSQISNALERSRRTVAVVSCRSIIAHEILRWIAAREVEWFSENQIDNSRVCYIFEKTIDRLYITLTKLSKIW